MLKTDAGDTALQLLSSRSFENEAAYHSVVEMMLKCSCRPLPRIESSTTRVSHFQPLHGAETDLPQPRSHTVDVPRASSPDRLDYDDPESTDMRNTPPVDREEGQESSSDHSNGNSAEEDTSDQPLTPQTPQRGRSRLRKIKVEATSLSKRRLNEHRDNANDPDSEEELLTKKGHRRKSKKTSDIQTDSSSGIGDESDPRSASGESDRRRRVLISYPPSPLSTEFESTDSSEVGHELYVIRTASYDFAAEQEQAITESPSTKDILIDAMNLRRLRSRSIMTHLPSVLTQLRGSPQILKKNSIILSPRQRSSSCDLLASNKGVSNSAIRQNSVSH